MYLRGWEALDFEVLQDFGSTELFRDPTDDYPEDSLLRERVSVKGDFHHFEEGCELAMSQRRGHLDLDAEGRCTCVHVRDALDIALAGDRQPGRLVLYVQGGDGPLRHGKRVLGRGGSLGESSPDWRGLPALRSARRFFAPWKAR